MTPDHRELQDGGTDFLSKQFRFSGPGTGAEVFRRDLSLRRRTPRTVHRGYQSSRDASTSLNCVNQGGRKSRRIQLPFDLTESCSVRSSNGFHADDGHIGKPSADAGLAADRTERLFNRIHLNSARPTDPRSCMSTVSTEPADLTMFEL